MSLQISILYFFVAMTAISAIAILFMKNVFKAALLLLICLLSLAALYVFSMAEFVAITQIMIYAGGVLVVIIFGVMLTSKIAGKPLAVTHAYVVSGSIAGLSIFVLLIKYMIALPPTLPHQAALAGNSVTNTGTQLMTVFAVPFEFAGILLLITLIGAAVVSSSFNKKG